MQAHRIGRVTGTVGELVTARLPFARVGESVILRLSQGSRNIPASVVRLTPAGVLLTSHGDLGGLRAGDPVESCEHDDELILGVGALGRALDVTGAPLDTFGPVRGRPVTIDQPPLSATQRRPIDDITWTGIRAIDGLLTIGRGARLGIFGAPSAGKSTLIEMIVRGVRADAVVLGLIGERGREAATWIEKLDARTTIVCSPSDRTAAERMRAATVALAQAGELRARGFDVLVVLDSLARFASAAREIAVAAGESVGRGGYPPSVFAQLARLVERAGKTADGSVTLLATVLSDGGDEREPLSDAARSLLDGHIHLSHELARAGHYPAIDVLQSVSRTMNDVVHERHRRAADAVRAALALLERTRDSRELGMAPADPKIARAVQAADALEAFMKQRADALSPPQATLAQLGEAAALVTAPARETKDEK